MDEPAKEETMAYQQQPPPGYPQQQMQPQMQYGGPPMGMPPAQPKTPAEMTLMNLPPAGQDSVRPCPAEVRMAKRAGQFAILALAAAACTGSEFDIGSLAGQYVIDGNPRCVANVTGSQVTVDCTRGSTADSTTITAEVDFSENRVSGWYQEAWRYDSWGGDIWESTWTLNFTATKQSGGSGGGAFGPFAGAWSVAGRTLRESGYNGVVEDSHTDVIAANVDVSGNLATFQSLDGSWAATANMAGGTLIVMGSANFMAMH
ncbi:MAG: hypothetical protein QME96_11910 [Myxococcota bacterium]|nr:hypothetical protein [Myxococcota bacterium]